MEARSSDCGLRTANCGLNVSFEFSAAQIRLFQVSHKTSEQPAHFVSRVVKLVELHGIDVLLGPRQRKGVILLPRRSLLKLKKTE